MTQNLTPGATIAQIGSTFAAQSVGAAYTATSGTITTATSTVTTGSIGLAGNVTVYIFGTYAGVTVNFEVSPDNTNWFTWPMQREQTGVIEASPILASNASGSWTIDAPGFNFFRVRASAWTSGTANVVINPGSYPITPVVSAVIQTPARTQFSLTGLAIVPVTTEAFASLVVTRALTAAAAATSQTVTTGKTLRITSITVTHVTTAAAGLQTWASLRAVTSAGTLSTTSPLLWVARISAPAAVAQTGGYLHATFPDGIELPSGAKFAIGLQSNATTGAIDVSVEGYEY
jgi:hypothetical protein